MRILITGAGGAAAISVWKSLNREHELHMADIDPCAAGLYLVPPEQRLILPNGNSPEFVTTLFNECVKRKINVVIATVDAELFPLAQALSQFEEAGMTVPLSAPETLQICRDKYALLQAAKDVVPVPEYTLLSSSNIASITDFPKFAKPRLGAGSTGIKHINLLRDLHDLPQNDSYLIQELLPGDEYSVDTYIDSKGNAIAAIPRLRMKIDSGIAVTARTVHYPELSHMALKIAEKIGIRYVANIQFKQAKDGQFKLLEINPRFSGTLPLTAAAGVDIPQLLIKDIAGIALPTGPMPFKEIMVVRYWTECFFSPTEWDALCRH